MAPASGGRAPIRLHAAKILVVSPEGQNFVSRPACITSFHRETTKNSGKLAVLALLAASFALPACRDASPVAAESADASAAGPALATSSGRPVSRMKVHDDFAGYQAFYEDGDSFKWIWVSVARAGPGANAHASLWILGGECTPWPNCTYITGQGTIPARDVTGSFGSGLAVHTDLRNNPDFSLEGAERGIVSIRWRRQRDGWYEGRFSGNSEWGWVDILTRQSGTWRPSAASATGEVLGRRVPEEGWTERSDLATCRQVIMEFERTVAN